MDERLLKCKPIRYLCPYCGKWHEWDSSRSELEHYDLYTIHHFSDELTCPRHMSNYKILFEGGYCYYLIDYLCPFAYSIFRKVPIASIVESTENPIVTFEVPFIIEKRDVKGLECPNCRFVDECNSVKLDDNDNKRYMNITLGLEFKQSDYNQFSEVGKNALKEENQKDCKDGIKSKKDCQMNQLLTLMLFKDKLSGDDDMMKSLLISSLMSSK